MSTENYEQQINDMLKKRVFKVNIGIPVGAPVPTHKRKTKKGSVEVNTNLTMPELANIVCYGTEKIPARNFLKVAKEKYGPRWKGIGEQVLVDIIKRNKDVTMSLETLGTIVKEDIKLAIIEKGAYTPNAEKTLRRKGKHKPPLVDEGYLMNSFQVLKISEES